MLTIRRTLLGATALATAAVVSGTAPALASPLDAGGASRATPHTNACGYDGYVDASRQPVYTHCGSGSVVIEVDHFFWATTYACMPAGSWHIPQGDSQWAIIGAEADGTTCTGGPYAIEGP